MGLNLFSTEKRQIDDSSERTANNAADDGAVGLSQSHIGGDFTATTYNVNTDYGSVDAAIAASETATQQVASVSTVAIAANTNAATQLADTYAGALTDTTGQAFDFGSYVAHDSLAVASKATDAALSFADNATRPASNLTPETIKYAVLAAAVVGAAFALRGD